MLLQDPTVLSGIVIGVGLIGVAAAVRGVRDVKGEHDLLDSTRAHVGGLISVQRGEATPEEWMARHQIPDDSHVADHIIAFVGGWLSGRLPTLGELHNLAARRERNRIAGRIVSGIVATLLIFGIAGTLLAIHPVLKGFNIPVAPDGSIQEAAKGAADVMAMIHGLGTAFSPSLSALGATIVLVAFRGWYSIQTSRLNQALDRFSLNYLFPVFRLRSLAEDFVKVEAKLSGLVDAIRQRDKGFEAAVVLLKTAAESFEEAAPKLKKTADAVSKASEKLAADAELVLNGLTNQFSGESDLVRNLKKSASAMEKAANEASRLVDATKAIDTRHQQLALSFEQNATSMKQAVDSVAAQVAAGVASGKGVIIDAAKGVVDDVARAARARVAKEVEPIIVSLGNEGSRVASAVTTLGRDVSSITTQVRGSAEAAAQTVNESSKAAAEMLKRVADEAASQSDITKRELEQVRGSAEAAAQTVNESSKAAAEMLKRIVDEAASQSAIAKRELEQVRESAEAAAQTANESSKAAEEMLKRAADEAASQSDTAKRELAECMGQVKTSADGLKTDLERALKETNDSLAQTVGVASVQITSAANEMAATKGKLDQIITSIENLSVPSETQPLKKGWRGWLK